MMLDRTQRTPAAAAVGVFLGLVAIATAQSCSSSPSPTTSPPLTISAGLSQTHFWVGNFMDPFADAIEAETDLTFTRFYAGELVAVGGELDALESGVISVAAPMLAPYHEGRFPLSDVTQLPTYGTDSPMITRAFQRLLASEAEVTKGKLSTTTRSRTKGSSPGDLAPRGPTPSPPPEPSSTAPQISAGCPFAPGRHCTRSCSSVSVSHR